MNDDIHSAPSHEETPPQSSVERKSQRKSRAFWWIAGAALALVAAGVGGYAIWSHSAAAAPSRALEQFLAALADGDLDAAMSFVDADPATSQLLTQEVLDASVARGPLRDVQVEQKDGDVWASFHIGDSKVSRTFDVRHDGERWVIVDALVPVSELAYFASTNTKVNGAAIVDAEALAFPGTYELTFDSPYFALEGETEFVIATAGDTRAIADTKVVLSEHGATTFTQLVSASLSECLSSKAATVPCGVDVEPAEIHGTFREGSATRTLHDDDQAFMGSIPHILLRSDLTTARVAQGLTVDFEFTTDVSDGYWEYEWDDYQLWPQVDFSVEPLSVAWTY